MSSQPLTAEARAALLAERRGELARYRELLDAGRLADALKPFARARRLEEEYAERLPVVSFGCCPYCCKPLMGSFDPFGLNGPWWAIGARRYRPPPCPHFFLLRGALAFADPPPTSDEPVAPGPAAPYVIPRLLELDGAVAVLGELGLAGGHTAYPVTYFAKPRPPVQALAAEWPDRTHAYTTAVSGRGYATREDPWEFELGPWLERGKLRWCLPGSGNRQLVPPCPYLDLPGERRARIVLGERVTPLD